MNSPENPPIPDPRRRKRAAGAIAAVVVVALVAVGVWLLRDNDPDPGTGVTTGTGVTGPAALKNAEVLLTVVPAAADVPAEWKATREPHVETDHCTEVKPSQLCYGTHGMVMAVYDGPEARFEASARAFTFGDAAAATAGHGVILNKVRSSTRERVPFTAEPIAGNEVVGFTTRGIGPASDRIRFSTIVLAGAVVVECDVSAPTGSGDEGELRATVVALTKAVVERAGQVQDGVVATARVSS
ncbi:hypothetical protein [Actinokineospora globicatena]|uniref:Uncharacterized protein n=1 Tax=Actinokineospora globicatena TaxID=103729 RepID=A0A9W6QMI4_9PSEU|nr:hypothetical protein [Actinokineospora globicatena]GLW91375.1 hypothetical protein Aglo03_21910 [Actinokineospora globicatena]